MRPGLSGRRGLVAAVVALLVGGGLAVVAAQATWLTISSGVVDLGVKGSDAVSVVVPLALLALAGVVGLVATRGVLRRVVGALLVLCGAGLVWGAVAVLADPHGVVPSVLRAQSVDPRLADAATVSVTGIWPVLVAVGGLLVVGAGGLALAVSRSWPAMGARYEAPAGAVRPGRPLDPWTALDRGVDPTADAAADGADGRGTDPAPPPAEHEVPE